MAVYSGGSISWHEAHQMTFQEREVAIKVINKYNKLKSGKSVSEEM